MATKALMNGTGWYQYITKDGKYVELRLKPLSEKHWYECSWNGHIKFQTRGKKDAVIAFNHEIENAKTILGL
jgi:hypothetical protein